MFTGIITATGKVRNVRSGKSFFVVFEKPRTWKLSEGASVAVNGICSTVRKLTEGTFEVEYMPETLKKTTAGNFTKGMIVNFERSMRLGDELAHS